jgi:Cu/Ag efflux protein CusF
MTAPRITSAIAAALLLGSSWARAAQQTTTTPITDAAKAQAQQAAEPVTKVNMLKMTATIQAIDSATRTVTLRDEMGNEDEYVVSTDMQRFNELKVGQKVDITYYESLVLQVLKPGEQGLTAASETALKRAKGNLPAATLASQDRRTVTVKSIDPSVPSVTVTTEDGRSVTRKIEDKSLLDRIKPGDRIDITFTRALITSVR